MPRRFAYPYDLTPDDDRWMVAFPDVPEALTGGATREEAEAQAQDCLEVALGARIDYRDAIPQPSPARGRPTAAPGAVLSAKLALYEAMRAEGITKVALAERIGVPESEIRRMLDPRRATKIGRLEEALSAVGQRLVVTTERVA